MKSVWLYSESLFNTLYIEILNTNLKRKLFEQNKHKKALFFPSGAPTHHRFTYNKQINK